LSHTTSRLVAGYRNTHKYSRRHV